MKKFILTLALTLLTIAAPALAENNLQPFYPLTNTPIIMAATTSSGAAASQITAAETPSSSALVVNTGSVTAFVAFGTSAITVAATTGIPIPPNVPMYFTLDNNHQYVAAITGTSTASVYIVAGRGSH